MKNGEYIVAAELDHVIINGIKYLRADQVAAPVPNGKRIVLVLDRGWIFAGDAEDKDGRIRLTRAVHVISWSGGIGYAGLLASGGRGSNVNIKKMPTVVDCPADAELFRDPVSDDWGL